MTPLPEDPTGLPVSGTSGDALEQRLRALRIANEARLNGHHIKSDLAKGHITFDQALTDPRAQACRVTDLMAAQYRWGPSKVTAVAHYLQLGTSVRVRDLTDMRRRRIANEVAARQDRMVRNRERRERLHERQAA